MLAAVAVAVPMEIEAEEEDAVTQIVASHPIPILPATTTLLGAMAIPLPQLRHRRTCLPRHILSHNQISNILTTRQPISHPNPSHNPQARHLSNNPLDTIALPTSHTLLLTPRRPVQPTFRVCQHTSMRHRQELQ